MERRNVVIIGGGPAGLAAAARLHALGIAGVTVLEREAEVGGIPRHCGHMGFGWQSHRRLWSGPRFARELQRGTEHLDVRTGTTVLALGEDGTVQIRDRNGIGAIAARRVLIATGIRETPRSARLIGGSRPAGVMNTGALQQHVYLHGHRPFLRPIIVGSEWVSFSAILTCRHLGIKPVAMIEEGIRIDAPRPGDLVARFFYGVPVHTRTRLVAIVGRQQVEAVMVERGAAIERINCDGVILTGRFRPENALFADGAIALEGLSPRVDISYRTSNPVFFAAGNVLGPLKTSGQCWQQGQTAAGSIAESLA